MKPFQRGYNQTDASTFVYYYTEQFSTDHEIINIFPFEINIRKPKLHTNRKLSLLAELLDIFSKSENLQNSLIKIH